MRKYVLVLGIALALSVSGALGIASRPDEPPAPAARTAPVVVPGAGRDLEATIASLQDTLRRVPSDHRSWATLGLAYVEQARVSGNPALYAKADAAVARALESDEDDSAPYSARAAIHAARHDFGEALSDTTRALSIDPYDPTALALRVDALTELGRYPQQLRSLAVADRRQPGVPVAARYAYAYELRGDLPRAAGILRRAVSAGTAPSDRAFLLTLLADVERRQGRLGQAAGHLEQASAALPGYVPTLVSGARLAVARGDREQAVTLWREVVATQPLPEYLTELGETYAALGRTDDAMDQYAVVDATLTLLSGSGVNTDLEAAHYFADHGSVSEALAVARAEWDRRKSIHVADALAWSLHAIGQDAQALRFARKATALGTQEARLWIHRGTIEAAVGLTADARVHLQRGLDADPGYSPWQADRARSLLADLEARR